MFDILLQVFENLIEILISTHYQIFEGLISGTCAPYFKYPEFKIYILFSFQNADLDVRMNGALIFGEISFLVEI